ncbi:hypothetical protein JCM8097_008953 [Rhodosporidiobolus ruineniae]
MGDQLESHVATFDPGLKLFIAIAAKISTLHALAGRYTQHLTLADLSPPNSQPSSPSESPPTAAESSANPASSPSAEKRPSLSPQQSAKELASQQRELDAEQARVRVLMKHTIAQATHWLVLVCGHFGVEMAQLPEEPDSGMRLPDALDVAASEEEKTADEAEKKKAREKREFDVVWELVLVSLGLVGAGQQAAEPEREKKAQSVGAKVGGLFKASSDASSSDSSQPPPLNYTALSRSLVVCTAEVLGIPPQTVSDVERSIAQFLYFELQQSDEATQSAAVSASEAGAGGKGEWDEAAKEYKDKAARKGSALKWAATGAGFVLGGVAIGLTGGLAAPALAPVLAGTFGIAAFSGAGGAVLIGTLLGLGGGGLAGYRTHRRMKGLENVEFEPIKDEDAHELPQIPSLTATIVASGFLLDLKDSVDPWRETFRTTKEDAFALKADPQTFLEAGRSLDSFVKSKLIAMGGVEVIKRTALAAVYAGVALPLTVFQGATTAFDSDFSRCRDKAKKAGVLLAEILEKQVQGKRPTVLIGYGPGATLVLSCLLELHKRQLGDLVYSAVLISLPEAPSAVAWASARSVVAHEVVNCYAREDWVLGIAARLYTLSARVAGLRPVQVEGITDLDISDLVDAHFRIRDALPRILDRVARLGRGEAVTPPASGMGTPALREEEEGEVEEVREGVEGVGVSTVERRGKAGEHDEPEEEEKEKAEGLKA